MPFYRKNPAKNSIYTPLSPRSRRHSGPLHPLPVFFFNCQWGEIFCGGASADKKHKKGLTANAVTPSITTFYKKTGPSQKEFELFVQEGILAYHTMKHNHSCRSMDCTAQLTKKLYEPKFSCARTKGEAIVNNVFAPWATNMVRPDLEQVEFVSLTIIHPIMDI